MTRAVFNTRQPYELRVIAALTLPVASLNSRMTGSRSGRSP